MNPYWSQSNIRQTNTSAADVTSDRRQENTWFLADVITARKIMEETKTSMIQIAEKAFTDNQRTNTKSENTFLQGAYETFENALDENEDFIVTLNTNAKENERGFVESHAASQLYASDEQAQSEENTIVIMSKSEDAKDTWKEESVNTQHEAELQTYGDSSSNVNTPEVNGENVDKSEEQNCNQPERDNEPGASKDKTANIEQIVIERTDKRSNITKIIHGKHDFPQNKNTEDRFKVDSVRDKNLSLGTELFGPGDGCEIAAIEHVKGNTQMDMTQEGEKMKSSVGSVSHTIVTGKEQEAGYITINNSGNAKGTFETAYLSDIILKRERAEHPTEEKLATRNELANISVGNSGTGITKDVFQGANKVQHAAISNAEKAEHETSEELSFRTEYADSTNEENCVSGNQNPNSLFKDDDKAQIGLPESYQYDRNKIRTHFNTIPVNVDFRNNNRAVVSEVDRDIHRTKKESDRQKPPYDNYEKIDRFETTDIKRSDETSEHFADSKTGIVQYNSGDNASDVFVYQQSNIINKTETIKTINECENIVIDLDRIELPEEKPFVRPEEENIQSCALTDSTDKVEHTRQEGNLFSVDTQKTETLQNMLSKDGADVYSTEFADDGVAENQNDHLPVENVYLDETLPQDKRMDIQANLLAETSHQVKTSSPTSDKSTDTSIDAVLDPNNGGFLRERHVKDRLGKSPIRKVAIPDIINNKKDYFECHFTEADNIKRDESDGFKEMLDSSQRKYSHNGKTEKENKSDSYGGGKKIYTGVDSTEEKQLSEQKVANTQIGHSNLLPENERSPKLDNSCNRSENTLTFPSHTASNAIREDLDVQSFEIREESKSNFSEEQSNHYSDTHFPTQKQLHNDVETYTENVSSQKGFSEPTVEEAALGFYSSHEDLLQEMRQDNPNEHYQGENVLTGQKDLIDHDYEDSNEIKVVSKTDIVITKPSVNIDKNTSQTFVNSKEGDDQVSHLIQDVYFHRDDTDLHVTKGIEPRNICDKLPLENQARDISKQDHKSDVCSCEIRVSAQDVRVGVMKDSRPNEAREIPTAIIEAQNSEVQLRTREIDKKNNGTKIDESERKLDYSSETNPYRGMDTRDGESAVDNSEIITDESSRCLPAEFTEVPDQKKVRQSKNMYMAGNEVTDVKVTHENANGAGISTNSSAARKNVKENDSASSEYEHKEVPVGYKESFKSDDCATTKQDAEMENASDNKSEDVQCSENDKHEESPMSKKDMQSTMVKLDTNDERSTTDTAAAEDVCPDDDSSWLQVKSGELLEMHNSSLQQKDRSDIEMDSTPNSARLNMTSTSRPKSKDGRESTEDTEIAGDEMHTQFRQSRACNVRVKIEENKGDTKKGTPSQKEISDSAVEKETNAGSSERDTNSQNLRNDSKGRNIDAENSNEIDEEMEQRETHSSNENAIYVHSFSALFKQKKTPDEMQTTAGCLSKVENEELESTGASEFNNKMEIISNESKNDQQDIQCNSTFEKQQIDLSEDEDSGSKKTPVALIPDLNYAHISEENPTEQSSGPGQKSSLSLEKEHQITHEDIGDGELEMKQDDSNPVAGKHNEELNDLSSTEKNSSDVSTDAYRATGYKHKPCTEEIVATTMSSIDEMKSGSDDDTSKTDINSAQDDMANQGNVYFGRKQPYSINMNDERERDNLEFQVHQKDTSYGKREVDAQALQDALKKPNLDEYIRFEENEDQEMHLVQNKDILTKSDKIVRAKEDEKVFTPGSKDESKNMVDDIFDLQQSKKMCEVKYKNTDLRKDSKSTNILEKNIIMEETRRNASIESTETTREADIEHKEEIHPESLQALVQANESTVYSDTAVSIFVQDIICNAIKNLQMIHNGEVKDEVSASESRGNTPNTDNKGTNNRIHPDFKPMEYDDNYISEKTKVQQEEMNSDGETQLHALNSDPVDSLSSKDDPTRCIDDGTKPYVVFDQNMEQEDKTNEKEKSGVDETKQKLKEGKGLDDTAVNSAADIICFDSSKDGSATKKIKAEVKSESQLLDKHDYLDERIENIGKDTVSKESQIEDKVGMINSETVEYYDAVPKAKELDEEDVHIYGSIDTLTNKEPPKDILVAANREDIVNNEVHVSSLEYVPDINGAKEKTEEDSHVHDLNKSVENEEHEDGKGIEKDKKAEKSKDCRQNNGNIYLDVSVACDEENVKELAAGRSMKIYDTVYKEAFNNESQTEGQNGVRKIAERHNVTTNLKENTQVIDAISCKHNDDVVDLKSGKEEKIKTACKSISSTEKSDVTDKIEQPADVKDNAGFKTSEINDDSTEKTNDNLPTKMKCRTGNNNTQGDKTFDEQSVGENVGKEIITFVEEVNVSKLYETTDVMSHVKEDDSQATKEANSLGILTNVSPDVIDIANVGEPLPKEQKESVTLSEPRTISEILGENDSITTQGPKYTYDYLLENKTKVKEAEQREKTVNESFSKIEKQTKKSQTNTLVIADSKEDNTEITVREFKKMILSAMDDNGESQVQLQLGIKDNACTVETSKQTNSSYSEPIHDATNENKNISDSTAVTFHFSTKKDNHETKLQHTTQASSQSTDKNMDVLQLNIEDCASVGEGTRQDFAPEADQTEDPYKVDARVVEGIGENIKISTKNKNKNNYIQCMSPDHFQTIDETQNELQLDMKNRIYSVRSTNPDASHEIKSNSTSEEDDERMTIISEEETQFSSQADSTKNKSQYLAQDEYTSTKETTADVKLCSQNSSSDVEATKQNFSPKAKIRIYLEKDGTKLIEGAGDEIELSTKSDNEERITQIKTQDDSQHMYETADNATKQDASVKTENMDPSRQDELTKTDGLSEEIQLSVLDDNDENKIEIMTLNDFKSIDKATDKLHLGIRNDTTNFKTTKQYVSHKEENINTSGQVNASVTDGITTDVWILGNENYDENGIKFVLEYNFKNIDEGEVQSDVRDSASTVKRTKHDVCPEAKFEETVSNIKQDAPLGLQDEAEDVIKTEVDISSEEIDGARPSESSIHGQDVTKDLEGKPGEIPSEGSSLLSHTDTYSALEIQTENLTDDGQDFFTIGDGMKGLEGITKEAAEKELESATEKKVITSTKEEADNSSDKTQDFNPKPNVENDSLHEKTTEDVSNITMVYSNEKELETTYSITKLETVSFNEISTDTYPVTQIDSQYVHETTQEPCFDNNMDSTLHKSESLIKDVIKAANNCCANVHTTTHASSKGVHEENKYYSLLSENEEPDGDFKDDHSKVEGNMQNSEQEKNRDMQDRNAETKTESADYHMYTNASSEKPREAYKDKLNSTGHIFADYETTKTYIVQDVEKRAEEKLMKYFSVEIEDLSESEQENTRNLDENIPGYNRMVRELLSADESNVNPDAAERDDTRNEDSGIKHQNEYSENFSSTDKEKHPNGNTKANKSEIDDSGESTDDAADLEPINDAKPDYVQKLTKISFDETDSKVAKVKATYTISISRDNFPRDGEKMPAINEKNKKKDEPDENNQYTAGNSAEIIAETRYLYLRETEVEDIIHIAQDKVSSNAEISNLHIKNETKDDDKSMTDAILSAVEKSKSIEIMKKEIDFATNNNYETPSESNKECYHTIEDGTSTIKGVTLNTESTMRTNTDTLTKDNENQKMSSTSDDDYCQAPADQKNTDTTVEELQSTAQIDKRCHNKKDGKTKEETELFDLSKVAIWDDLQTHAETENLSHIVKTIGIVNENPDNHEEVKYVNVTVDQSSTDRTQDNRSLVQAETISNNKTTENKTLEETDDVKNLIDTTDENAVGYKKAKYFVHHYLQTNGPKDQEIERKEEDNTKYVESETGSQSSNTNNDNDNNPQTGNEMKETSHAIQNYSVVEKDEHVDVQEKPAPSTLKDDNGKAGETIQAHTATSDDKMNTSNRTSFNPNTSNFPSISVEATKELHLPDEQIQVKDEVAKDKEGTISMEIESAVEEKTNIEQSSHKVRYPLKKYSEMVDETRDKRDIKTQNDDKDLTLKKPISAAVFEEETFPSLNENHDIDEHMGQKISTEKSQYSHVATEDLCMASEHDNNNVANVTKELSQLTQDKAYDQTLKVSDTSRQDTGLSPDAEEDVNFNVDPDIDKLFQASIHTIQEHDEIMKGISLLMQGNIETVKETKGYVKFFEAGLVKVVSEPIQDLNAKAEETTDSGEHTFKDTNSMTLYNFCNELRERPSSEEHDNDRNVDVEGESFNSKTLSSYQHVEGNTPFAPLESTKQAENCAQDAEEEITDDKPEADAGSKSTCEQKASRKVNNGGDVQMGGYCKPIIENDLETIGAKKKNMYLDEENLKLSDPEGEEITTSSIDIQHTDTTSYNTVGKSEAEHPNNNDRTNGTTSSTSVFRNDDSPGAKYDSNSIDEDTQKQQALTKKYIGVSVQEEGDSYHIFENDRENVSKTTEKLQLTTEFLPLSHKNSKSREEDDENNFAKNNVEKAHDADNDQLYSEERFLLQKSEKIVESGNLEKQHETNNGNDSRIVENPYPMLFNTGNEEHNDTHGKQFAREPHLVTHDAAQAAIKNADETELNSNYAANDRDENLNIASLYSRSSIYNTTETNIYFPISGEFYLTEQDEMLVEIGKRTPEKMENTVNAEENMDVPSTEEFCYETDHNKISIKTTQETAQADRENDSIFKDDTKRSDKETHQNDPDVKGKREDITETAIHIISTNDKLSKEVSYEVHDDSTFKQHGNVNVISPERPAEKKDEVIVTSENATEIMSKIPTSRNAFHEISDENSVFQVETNLQNVDEATAQRLQDQMQIKTAHDVHNCKEFGGFAETVTASAEQTWKELDITNKNGDIMDKKSVDAYHSETQVFTEMTTTPPTINIDTSEHLIYETVKSASNYKNESQYSSEDFVHLEKNHHVYNTNSKAKAVEIPISELRKYDSAKPELNAPCISDNLQTDESQSANNLEIDNTLSVSKQQEGNDNVPYVTVNKELLSDTEKPIHGISHKSNSEIAINSIDYVDSSQAKSNHSVNNASQSVTPHEEIESLDITKYAELESGQIFDPRGNVSVYVNGDLSYKVTHEEEIERQPKIDIIPDITKLLTGVQSTKSKTKETDVEHAKDVHYIENGEQGTRNNHNLDERRVRDTNILSHDECPSVKECKLIFDYSSECWDNSEQTLLSLERSTFTEHPQNESESESIVHNMIANVSEMEVMKLKPSMNMTVPDSEESEAVEEKEARYFPYLSAVSRIVDLCSLGIRTNDPLKRLVAKSSNKIQDEPVPSLSKTPGTEYPRNLSVQNRSVEQADSKVSNEVLAKSEVIGSRCDISEQYIGKSNNVDSVDNTQTKENKSDSAVEHQVQMSEKGHGKSSIDSDKSTDENELHDGETVFRNTQNTVSEKVKKSSEDKDKDNNTTDDIGIKILDGNVRFVEDTFSKPRSTIQGKENQQTSENIEDVDSEDFSRKREAKDVDEEKNYAERMLLEDDIDYMITHLKLSKQDTECIKLEEVPSNKQAQMLYVSHAIEEGNVTEDNIASEIGNDYLRKAVLHPVENGAPIILQDNDRSENDEKFEKSKDESTKGPLNDHALTYKEIPISKNKKDESSRPAPTKLVSLVKELKKTLEEETEMQLQYMGSLKSVREDIKRGLEAFKSIQFDERSSREHNDSDSEYSTDTNIIYHEGEDSHSINQEEDFSEFWKSLDDDEFGLSRNYDRTVAEKDTQTEEKRFGVANDSEVLESGEQEKNNIPTRSKDEAEGGDADKQMEMNEEEEKEQRREKQELSDIIANRDANEMLDLKLIKKIKPSEKNSTEATILPSGNESTESEKDTKASFRPGMRKYTDPNISKYHAPKGNPKIDSKWPSDHPAYQMLYRRELTPGKLNVGTRLHVKRRNINERGQPQSPIKAIHSTQRNGATLLPPIHHPSHPEIREDIFKTKQYLEYLHKHPIPVRPRKSDKTIIPLDNRQGECISLSLPNLSDKLLLSPLQLHQELLFDPHPPTCPRKPFSAKELAEMEEYLELIQSKPDSHGRSSSSNQVDLSHNRPIEDLVEIIQVRKKFYLGNREEKEDYREHRIHQIFRELQRIRKKSEEAKDILIIRKGVRFRSGRKDSENTNFIILDYSHGEVEKMKTDEDLRKFLCEPQEYELCAKGRPLYRNKRRQRAYSELKDKLNKKTRPRYDRLC